MKINIVQKEPRATRQEDGFMLVFCLVSLAALSILGVWAMNNSSIENLIAGNHQRYEEGFQVSEGAVSAEGGELGYARADWYKLPDPNAVNLLLVPPDNTNYDPGNDDPTNSAKNAFDDAANADVRDSDPDMWPYQNLTRNLADNEYDYRYLVTYLGADDAGKGEGSTDFSAYLFSINCSREADIEMGGKKIGPSLESYSD